MSYIIDEARSNCLTWLGRPDTNTRVIHRSGIPLFSTANFFSSAQNTSTVSSGRKCHVRNCPCAMNVSIMNSVTGYCLICPISDFCSLLGYRYTASPTSSQTQQKDSFNLDNLAQFTDVFCIFESKLQADHLFLHRIQGSILCRRFYPPSCENFNETACEKISMVYSGSKIQGHNSKGYKFSQVHT